VVEDGEKIWKSLVRSLLAPKAKWRNRNERRGRGRGRGKGRGRGRSMSTNLGKTIEEVKLKAQTENRKTVEVMEEEM